MPLPRRFGDPPLLPTEPTRSSILFVIAIEGEKTEKLYFETCKRHFLRNRLKVEILPPSTGESTEPDAVLARLKQFKEVKQSELDFDPDDQYWLVIDVDHRTKEHLNEIHKLAQDQNFKSAISNPCFEFWLFLHQYDVSDFFTRCPKINEVPLDQRSKTLKGINLNYNYHALRYDQFRDDVLAAISKVYKYEKDGSNKDVPDFPGTTVHRLVEEIITQSNTSSRR